MNTFPQRNSFPLEVFVKEIQMAFFFLVLCLNKIKKNHSPFINETILPPLIFVDLWGMSKTENHYSPDKGLSEEDAEPVYKIMDKAFKKTFPKLAHLSRTDSANHVSSVINVVKEGLGCGIKHEKEIEKLLSFSGYLVESFSIKINYPSTREWLRILS